MNMMYIEDCCEILDSMRVPITASDRKKGEYPYYGANGIQDYVSDYIFDDELVLLAEDGGNFGSKEKPIAYRVSGKCWVNNHAHVLKPKAGLNVDYLCYSLMFYNVEGIINGATRQKLTQSAMRKMKIPVRTMKEQIQIVDKLNRIIRIKEQRKQELSELDTLIKARFVEMFGDIITNEKNWSTDKWGNVLKIINGKNQRNIESEYGEFLICGSGGPMGRGTDYLTKENSVIIGRKGNINKPILMREKYWNVDTAFGIEPNEEHINVEYLYMFCNFFNFEILNKAVTIPSLTKSDLLNIEIPIPDMVIQKQFTNFVQQIDKLRFGGRKRLTKAKNTKNNNRNTITLERSTLYGK